MKPLLFLLALALMARQKTATKPDNKPLNLYSSGQYKHYGYTILHETPVDTIKQK